jgi:hypothetical protein
MKKIYYLVMAVALLFSIKSVAQNITPEIGYKGIALANPLPMTMAIATAKHKAEEMTEAITKTIFDTLGIKGMIDNHLKINGNSGEGTIEILISGGEVKMMEIELQTNEYVFSIADEDVNAKIEYTTKPVTNGQLDYHQIEEDYKIANKQAFLHSCDGNSIMFSWFAQTSTTVHKTSTAAATADSAMQRGDYYAKIKYRFAAKSAGKQTSQKCNRLLFLLNNKMYYFDYFDYFGYLF